jgi:hypothetical protein
MMNPQLLEMVGRERDQDRSGEIVADRLAKTLRAQRPARYRRLMTWLADLFAAVGRKLQILRTATEIASE